MIMQLAVISDLKLGTFIQAAESDAFANTDQDEPKLKLTLSRHREAMKHCNLT